MADLAFRKSSRLLNSHDFQRVFKGAAYKVSHRHCLILAIPNALNHPRLGLVIAKKNIRLAVQRNRVKRAIRETFRLKQHKLPNIDAIVLARSQLDSLSDQELNKLFDKSWDRLIDKVRKQTLKDADKASSPHA
ncbi:MAG: ribonuclease P protein component [Cellvibrionaceae bacterium]